MSKYAIRKLTPTECYMLMGMTAEDTEKCYAVGMSDSALYKSAGNGIVTNCPQLIFEHLYKTQHEPQFKCMDEDKNFIHGTATNRQPLTANILFSGVGMQDRGIVNTGCWDLNVLATSDIDKNAVVSYAAIHCGLTTEMIENYPNYPSREEMVADLERANLGYDPIQNKQYDWARVARKRTKELEKFWLANKLSRNVGDVSRLEKLPIADLWTYSFPCFTADTLVLTKENGYIPIKDIKIGDSVLTHTNTYKTVTASQMTGIKNIYRIDAMMFDNIECTANHKFYVRTKHRKNTRVKGKAVNFRYFDTPIFKECENLTVDDYLGYAINTNSVIPEWNGIEHIWHDGRKNRKSDSLSELMPNENFWWLIGRYIADGWHRTQGGVCIACGKGKEDELSKRLNSIGINYCTDEIKSVTKFHIPLKELEIFTNQFGYKAIGKFIPSFVFDMPVALCKAFLDGYWSGDGCFTNGMFKATTISRTLAYGIGQLIAKVYHRPFSIYKSNKPNTCVIEGRTVNQHENYSIVFKLENCKQDKAFYEDGYIWFPINKISNTETEKDVYDITVEEDHSFTANGSIVHNCTDISVAGKMKGMVEGGTRSGLLYEVTRLLETTPDKEKPKYLLMENVKNLVGKQFKPQFDKLCEFLDSLGYNNYWQVMNAKNTGIPQNRERIFMLSIRKDIDNGRFNTLEYLDENGNFQFAKPFDSGMRLKDVLFDEVDDKYYITTEKADELVQTILDNGYEQNGE